MGSTTNNNWYNLNTTRKYPLDDGATGIDDTGKVLPATIISDINIRLPKSVGVGVMISSIVVSDTLVSVTFLAINHPIKPDLYDTAPPAAVFTPLCAVSVKKPLIPGTPCVVSSFVEGVAGWVVFGDGIGRKFNGRFSTAAQSALNPKTCRYYNDLPVSSISKVKTTQKLRGLVTLIEGKDVSITKQSRTIDGESKDVIVFALKDNVDQTVLSDYLGPCEKRPESKNCAKEGIEFLNTVDPDCNGNINLEFLYPFELAIFETSSEGIAVDYPVGLIDACTRGARLPDATGKLPSQNVDQCNPTNEPNPDEGLEGNATLPPPIAISSVANDCIDLPACVNFDLASRHFWQEIKGTFTFIETDSPIEPCTSVTLVSSSSAVDYYTSSSEILYYESSSSYFPYTVTSVTKNTYYNDYIAQRKINTAYKATSTNQRNISLWYNCGYESTENIRILTDMYLIEGNTPATAGIVLNYRTNAEGTSDEYYVAEITRRGSAINIRRFNGFTYVTAATLKAVGIGSATWYRLEVLVEPSLVINKTKITFNVYSVPDLSLVGSVITETALYLPATGKVGLTSVNSQAVFSFFSMENI
jgi:hypothetical protein